VRQFEIMTEEAKDCPRDRPHTCGLARIRVSAQIRANGVNDFERHV
jgi:hypothetical protein